MIAASQQIGSIAKKLEALLIDWWQGQVTWKSRLIYSSGSSHRISSCSHRNSTTSHLLMPRTLRRSTLHYSFVRHSIKSPSGIESSSTISTVLTRVG